MFNILRNVSYNYEKSRRWNALTELPHLILKQCQSILIDPYGAYMCHNPLMAVGTVSILITKETFIWRVEKPELHLVSLKGLFDRQRVQNNQKCFLYLFLYNAYSFIPEIVTKQQARTMCREIKTEPSMPMSSRSLESSSSCRRKRCQYSAVSSLPMVQ